jgi:hypothetical protein
MGKAKGKAIADPAFQNSKIIHHHQQKLNNKKTAIDLKSIFVGFLEKS